MSSDYLALSTGLVAISRLNWTSIAAVMISSPELPYDSG